MLLYVFEGWNRNNLARVEIDKITQFRGRFVRCNLHSRKAIATPVLPSPRMSGLN